MVQLSYISSFLADKLKRWTLTLFIVFTVPLVFTPCLLLPKLTIKFLLWYQTLCPFDWLFPISSLLKETSPNPSFRSKAWWTEPNTVALFSLSGKNVLWFSPTRQQSMSTKYMEIRKRCSTFSLILWKLPDMWNHNKTLVTKRKRYHVIDTW